MPTNNVKKAIADIKAGYNTDFTKSESLQALQEKLERDNPQPLTLEQLKERVNKPVYVNNWGWEFVEDIVLRKDLAFGRGDKFCVKVNMDRFLIFDDFKFYDFRPKEKKNEQLDI